MKNTVLTIFRAAAILALTVPFCAAFAAEKFPPAIQTALDNGMHFESRFQAAGGLTGWVLSQGVRNNVILYTPANGDVAIAGNMFDAKGTNLTKQYLEKHAPQPDYSKVWGELERSAWVAEGAKTGDAKSVVYVFEDANCGYCNLAWKALLPYTHVGLQIRWVPVAFLSADSLPKAAALLDLGSDASAAVTAAHANFGKKLTSQKPVSDASKAKIEGNAKLMRQYGFNGTPAIFYKDKTGKVKAINGMPNLADIPDITGLPEQKVSDAAAAK